LRKLVRFTFLNARVFFSNAKVDMIAACAVVHSAVCTLCSVLVNSSQLEAANNLGIGDLCCLCTRYSFQPHNLPPPAAQGEGMESQITHRTSSLIPHRTSIEHWRCQKIMIGRGPK